MFWKKAVVSPDATIEYTMRAIDESGLGVALVVDGEGRLVGLATDGDLRRALLGGRTLQDAIAGVMNREPKVGRVGTAPEEIFAMMGEQIRHVPVVDETGVLVDVVTIADLYRRIPWAIPYIGLEELNEVAEAFRANWVTMGPRTRKLEEQVAAYVGRRHAIAVNNGTAALDVALKLLGIGPGDEVIVPAFTYIATVNAVLYQHATPVLADVDPISFNLDPADVVRRITPRTRAIMTIDYGGQSADYEALESVAREHNVALIEDGAQSLGAAHHSQRLCSFGVVSTTSFHAAKVVTSVEGGMLFTDDDRLADAARIIRNQGEDPKQKYQHIMLGHNYRMSDLHAAVGLVQFSRLGEVVRRRAEIAAAYTERLRNVEGVTLPQVRPGNQHAWFFYPILVPQRDAVAAYLQEKGVETRIAWPMGIHHQPLYRERFAGMHFPTAERIAASILNLPMYYTLGEMEMEYVVVHLKTVVDRLARV